MCWHVDAALAVCGASAGDATAGAENSAVEANPGRLASCARRGVAFEPADPRYAAAR
jgi:hypothetical protein